MTETVKKLRKPGTAAVRPAKSPTRIDPTITCFRALSTLTVADEDGIGTHQRVFGDYVPEAVTWKNLALYLKQGSLEKVYINQSELDRGMAELAERYAVEDAEKLAAKEEEEELAALEARRQELLAKRGKPEAPAPKKVEDVDISGEKTVVEKIDMGGIKSKHAGMPRPVALPSVRNTMNIPNVGENRKAPSKVLKKKG